MSRFPSALPSSAPTTTAHLVQQRLRRLPLNHQIRHSVRVLFVAVPSPAHSILELHPTTLLNHMSSLVRRGMQAGLVLESDGISRGVGLCTHGLVRLGRRTSDMGLHGGNIMMTERCLDLVQMGELGR